MVNLALEVPRPTVLLLAQGIVRDLTLPIDLAEFQGRMVALQSAAKGDHQAYRHLQRVLAGTHLEGTTAAQIQSACPRGAVVGIAMLATCTPAPHGWRVHLELARPVVPFIPSSAAPPVRVLPPDDWRALTGQPSPRLEAHTFARGRA